MGATGTSATVASAAPTVLPDRDLRVLDAIQRRVLWLATSAVHHANTARENASGVKVGGHQASSASVVSIMTALYFGHLTAKDRVSVKPHAAPVLHAIEYLLGNLDAGHLMSLRAFGGLQSYPSRKDPVPADFSTGSVGIGATATIWSAIAHRYLAGRFDVPDTGRYIAVLGDAELDEGACWEAIVEPLVGHLGEVLWIVDVNRQSLDRIVPGSAVARRIAMFEAAGWRTRTLKYGRRLEALLSHDRGAALRSRIDEMSNEEYQRLLRVSEVELRERLPAGPHRRDLVRLLGEVSDQELFTAFRDLGGHDLSLLLDAFAATDAVDRPTAVFAYTIKGWGLPTAAHPGNHAALLTEEQWLNLAAELGVDASDPWPCFPKGSPEAALCRRAAAQLDVSTPAAKPVPTVPSDLHNSHAGTTSTQQSFGRLLSDLARKAPELTKLLVTVSPDVASSTNLGSWINRVGIWDFGHRDDWFSDDRETLIRWLESQEGQHLELGIAEVNLVGLLSELGSTWSRDGQPLLPIGTLYDSFVTRALEPWSFGMYGGSQSILVGTPSGVTLAPEGGAHQSIITPSVGIEQPQCVAWEPAFGQDLEWTFLQALSQLGRPDGTSSYFRLTTRPIDQNLARVPSDPAEREQRRRRVLAGGYPLRLAPQSARVTLVGVGAVLPEVTAAADVLDSHGVPCDVICLTSPDLIFRALQARQGLLDAPNWILADLFPAERSTPTVTVIDGHPHTLAFLSAIRQQPTACLGVSDFGQSGDVDDLYRYFGIDSETIVGAALDLLHGTPA